MRYIRIDENADNTMTITTNCVDGSESIVVVPGNFDEVISAFFGSSETMNVVEDLVEDAVVIPNNLVD